MRGLFLVLLSVWGMKAESTGLEENGEKSFVHPGIVVTKESMSRMKDYIARRAYPVYEGFLLLKSSPRVGEAYKMNGPYPYISHDHPDYKYTSNGMSSDFSAAYEDALMWVLTDNRMYARKSMDILSAYASTLQGIPESNDRMLLAGLEGFKIASALEILKHTDSGIPGTEIENVVAMLKEHFQRAMVCEVAWHQGDDLYGLLDNRFLRICGMLQFGLRCPL